MTFSIIGFDPDTGDLGVAVQSKFPNVGVSIPFAKAGVGAIATQCYCNTSFGPRGLELLQNGASPEQALDILVGSDPDREYRQVGIINAKGEAANFTGKECFDFAGGLKGKNYSVQANVVASEQVIQAMGEQFEQSQGSLAEKLMAALQGGQAAGGDKRGQQSAALLVVRDKGGYGGHDDRYIDISVYDNPEPIKELKRLYEIHRLTYFRSEPTQLTKVDSTLAKELQTLLSQRGFYDGEAHGDYDRPTQKALFNFMGWENYDERMRDDDLVDLEVIEDMRKKHQVWLNNNKK